jgi:hypothetical protein
MGELIRFVSHEVGHTLGLRHNMGQFCNSSWKIENKTIKLKWTHFLYHGLCPFNYVAQPEDGVTALFPRIGIMTNGLSNGVLLFWRLKRNGRKKWSWMRWPKAYKNSRLWFGTESSPYDPDTKQKILAITQWELLGTN